MTKPGVLLGLTGRFGVDIKLAFAPSEGMEYGAKVSADVAGRIEASRTKESLESLKKNEQGQWEWKKEIRPQASVERFTHDMHCNGMPEDQLDEHELTAPFGPWRRLGGFGNTACPSPMLFVWPPPWSCFQSL